MQKEIFYRCISPKVMIKKDHAAQVFWSHMNFVWEKHSNISNYFLKIKTSILPSNFLKCIIYIQTCGMKKHCTRFNINSTKWHWILGFFLTQTYHMTSKDLAWFVSHMDFLIMLFCQLCCWTGSFLPLKLFENVSPFVSWNKSTHGWVWNGVRVSKWYLMCRRPFRWKH